MIGLLVRSTLSSPSYKIEDSTLYISGDGNITAEDVVKASPNKDFVSLIIQDQVKAINAGAFVECSKLVNVDATPITHILDKAFQDCLTLESIIFGDKLEFIGYRSFSNCVKVNFSEFPESLKHIGELSFYNCDSLPIIKIPKALTFIGPAAFADCFKFDKFEIDPENPQFVAGIDGAMYNKDLTQLFMYPAGINNTSPNFEPTCTYIRTGAFRGQNTLDSMIIPDTVDHLGDSACDNMHELVEVVIPGSIKKLPYACFRWCDMLESVVLNEGLVEVGAFCFQLTHISLGNLPKSLLFIGASAFQSTRIVHLNAPSVVQIADSAFAFTMKMFSANLPAAESIGSSAFMQSNVELVTVTENLKRIGSTAFSYAMWLTTFELPKSLESIGEEAFSGTSLSSMVIPANVSIIPRSLFQKSGIDTVVVEGYIKKVENSSFADCEYLKNVTFLNTVEEMADDAFNTNPPNATIIYCGRKAVEGNAATKAVAAVVSTYYPKGKLFAGVTPTTTNKCVMPPLPPDSQADKNKKLNIIVGASCGAAIFLLALIAGALWIRKIKLRNEMLTENLVANSV